MSNCHLNLPPVEFTLKQGEAYYQSDYRLLLIVAVVSYLAKKSVHWELQGMLHCSGLLLAC